ncbi:PLC-like phosphodiesterase [Bombardia bombarda]|uniref:PLC-like phosphodiesterase n=1 Tax=Bombardia bombarda TaxID=252184 RepID=A0AA40C545_9PEZI|nr:PLC-like phosphodiesterase [Bombardia bombarda]
MGNDNGNLIIRNLTITPLELIHVDRFEATPPSSPPPGKHNGGISKIAARFTHNFKGTPSVTAAAHHAALTSGAPTSSHDITDLLVQPFSERTTDISAPGAEYRQSHLRLTFFEPGEESSHRYTADIPGPSPRSIVMTASPSPSNNSSTTNTTSSESDSDPPKEFTLIYIPTLHHLSIFSSASLPTWMSRLSPYYPLSSLSIPGTHNSPTCYVALPSVRCQAVSVTDQLLNGVRFLDIRVSCPGGAVPYFHDLLNTEVYPFLDAHPSETILVSLKREGTGKGTDQQLSQHLHAGYFTRDLDKDGRPRWYTNPTIPTLGDVRGRVVLVRRFNIDDSLKGEHDGRGLGIDGSVWPDNCADGTCGSGTIRVQDYYELAQSSEIGKKTKLVQEELERAAQQVYVLPGMPGGPQPQSGPLPLFVNFLSGSNFFNASCWPENIAKKINPAIIEYLCRDHGAPGKGPGQLTIGDAATGIVVTDWVGNNGDWDLIRCIVGWNARLQLKS